MKAQLRMTKYSIMIVSSRVLTQIVGWVTISWGRYRLQPIPNHSKKAGLGYEGVFCLSLLFFSSTLKETQNLIFKTKYIWRRGAYTFLDAHIYISHSLQII